MTENSRLTIGALAAATSTKVVTIRYYEQMGLLPTPPRTASNYRSYDTDHLHRLLFIRRCRGLGFSLNQVRDLLRLSSDEKQDCAEVDRIADENLSAVESKIADLQRLATELRRISKSCQGGTVANCRIVEALGAEDQSASIR